MCFNHHSLENHSVVTAYNSIKRQTVDSEQFEEKGNKVSNTDACWCAVGIKTLFDFDGSMVSRVRVYINSPHYYVGPIDPCLCVLIIIL